MKQTKRTQLALLAVGLAIALLAGGLWWGFSSIPLQAQPAVTEGGLWHSAVDTAAGSGRALPANGAPAPALAPDTLVNDGSFENIPSAWTESINMTACGNLSKINDWTSIFTPTLPYDGNYYLWVGGLCLVLDPDEPISNSAEQVVTIPAGEPILSFWYNAQRWEPDGPPGDDIAFVEVDQQIVWQLELTQANNTNGWVNAQIDLSSLAGQTVSLRFANVAGTADILVGNVLFDLLTFEPLASAPESTPIDPVNGGTLVFTDPQGLPTIIEVPGGAVTETTTLVYQPQDEPGFAPLPSGFSYANHAFDLDAFVEQLYLPAVLNGSASSSLAPAGNRPAAVMQNDHAPLGSSFTFIQPITITIEYSDTDIGLIGDENTLALYFFNLNTGQWEDALSTCPQPGGYTSDPATNTVQLQVCHLSRMGLIGR